MRTSDLTPLFRSTIGFDRLFDLVETAQRMGENHYPPYNIERLAEDRYEIMLAVAGFSPDEISITAEQNVVTVEGKRRTTPIENSFIGGFRPGRSSANSALPITYTGEGRVF